MEDDKKPYNLRPRQKRRKPHDDGDEEPETSPFPAGNFIVLPMPLPIGRQGGADDSDEDSPQNGPTLARPIVLKTPEERKYFESLETRQRRTIARNMREVMALDPTKPLKFHVLESNLPASYKRTALQKLDMLQNMGTNSGEYNKLKQWVDGLMNIPLGVYKPMPVCYNGSNVAECREFLQESQTKLDQAIYGLQDAKSQTLQILAQWITCPGSSGQVIALQGPAGIGKTSFAQEGIAKVLGRPFFFIGLGGSTDASFMNGHSYTYEGSRWGRLADVLMHAKCMNPVIFFDEVDKVSDTAAGQEIINILMHITDRTQNSLYTDKYFQDVHLDLSQVLFIFSMNDESKVNAILRDRMTILRLPGYSFEEKVQIGMRYVLPKLLLQFGFPPGSVQLPQTVLEHLIREKCPAGEGGVRSIIRVLEKILSRLNVLRLSGPGRLPWHAPIGNAPYELSTELCLKLLRDVTITDTKDVSLQMMYL